MRCRAWLCTAVLAAVTAMTAGAGTFGKVVPIGGHASDLALDEGRGVLYVANFTANRVEVVSLATNSVSRSYNVASQPSSLALSPDAKYLVVAHYSNFQQPMSSGNALTVINLESNARATYAIGAAPLGVAFAIDGRALVATSKDFRLFDPVLGTSTTLMTIEALVAKTLPQQAPTFPPEITAASMAASRDGLWIFGVTDTIQFSYDVSSMNLLARGYTAEPPLGPRTVSVSDDGRKYTAGWALWEGSTANSPLPVISQFPDPTGDLHVGSHVIDSSRNLIYAQIPAALGATGAANRVLQIVDGDNLAVLERLQLPENLAGKGVLSNDYNTAYVVSDSGVLVLPVGNVAQQRRLQVSSEDVLFKGNFCDRRVGTQEILITDPSGAATDFAITSPHAGVRVQPSSGTTPARVRISVDPNAFQNSAGTTAVELAIRSNRAVNLPKPVRVLVNTREPDQRGVLHNVAGNLVDILADPARDRFYILRQDTNQVLVFDSNTYTQIAALKTGNTPTQLAISFDRRFLMVGSDNSQILYVYDLDTLEPGWNVRMPAGHYPRSIAASGKATLVATRVAGPVHVVDRVDLINRTAVELPSLGIYKNDIDQDSVLIASPNGSSILMAQKNGTLMLYNANADTFTAARKDGSGTLSGAYAASNYDQFVVGNALLNSSLVNVSEMESGTGLSSGFAFVGEEGLRATAPSASQPGVMQRVDPRTGENKMATRTAEAPVLGALSAESVFTRTLAPLANRSAIVQLTTSGFTVLPWDYDKALAPPRIDRVVNAADFSSPVAPGGLISIYGGSLSPTTQASSTMPLPTVLAESCLTVNGTPVPMMYVSGSQINAQLPFQTEGNTSLILRTPGGVSDTYNLTISPAAPSVFRTWIGQANTEVPTVVRSTNYLPVTASNPIHRDEYVTIYATGLGKTSPSVDTGFAAPRDPLAIAVIPPVVTVGGVPVNVTYAGLAPDQVGVYQINVYVGGNVPTGWNVPLEITQGSGTTSVNVRVVN